ncbi:hypothetical protein L7F22_029651 [Adiantum nelumboides]|nr:hypothetical protein [Adiantum nelumboides]
MPPRTESGGSSLPRTGSSTAYSIYPTDSVQDVAESLGLPPLKESVAAALASDVEYRLRQVVQDASKFMRHAKRAQLGQVFSVWRYPTPVGSTFRRIQTQSGPIHVVSDEEIDLDKVLESGPTVALGPGVGWSAHWLAVEGVQPSVPQNPTVSNGASAAINTTAAPASSHAVNLNGASAVLAATGAAPGQAVAKPLIKHVLSRELQLYFERLTTAIIDPPREAEVQGQKDSTSDSGLHQLVPYLIQWVGERVQSSLRDEKTLEVLLQTINAIVMNPFLGIESYLHQLLPFVLSILLTSTLGASTSSRTYALRSQAGSVLAYLLAQYSSTYPTLKPRVVRTVLGALDAGCRDASALEDGERSWPSDKCRVRLLPMEQVHAAHGRAQRPSWEPSLVFERWVQRNSNAAGSGARL